MTKGADRQPPSVAPARKKTAAHDSGSSAGEVQKWRTKRATLKDVANEANVSVMTVSNVINRKAHLVRPQTLRSVNDAIARLNYRPHSRARSLRLSREFVVGLIIVDPSPRFLTDWFNTHVVAGLGNFMNKRGYALSIQGVTADRIDDVPVLMRLQTDALCVTVSGDPSERLEIYRRFEQSGQPIVVLQEQVPGFLSDASSVRQDDFGGGAMLAQHVLMRGCRKLLYLNEAHGWPALDNRLAGIRDEAQRLRDEASIAVASCRSTRHPDVVAALDEHVTEQGLPDAVLCGNDQIALFVLRWFADRRISVPDQVRVTGFNAFEFGEFATPSLTTVRSPAYEIGEAAGSSVLQRLDSGHFLQRDLILSVQLEVGASA